MKKILLFIMAIFCTGTFAPKFATPLFADEHVMIVEDSLADKGCIEEKSACEQTLIAEDVSADSREDEGIIIFTCILVIIYIAGIAGTLTFALSVKR